MKAMRKNVVHLAVAAGIMLSSAMVYGQAVMTPFSPNENGPVLNPSEEAALQNSIGTSAAECVTPYSPNECGPAEARGGTLAPELGGTLGSGMHRLPDTPGPNPHDLIGQPE